MCSTRCMSRNATPSTQTGYSPEPGCARCLGDAAAPFSPRLLRPAPSGPRRPGSLPPLAAGSQQTALAPRPGLASSLGIARGPMLPCREARTRAGSRPGTARSAPGSGLISPPPPPSPQGGRPCAPSCLGRSEPPPRPGCRAPTHRIAFGATRSCQEPRGAGGAGDQEPPGPPGLRSQQPGSPAGRRCSKEGVLRRKQRIK